MTVLVSDKNLFHTVKTPRIAKERPLGKIFFENIFNVEQ